MKKSIAAFAASAVLIPGAAVLAAGMAQAAPEDTAGQTGVRSTDLIPALSDTRATGHKDFLAQGIHVWTEGATSTDKVAEYFPVTATGGLPTTAKMAWFGTGTQPGVQIVFDVDSTTGNGNDYNILIGESIYGVDANGNYTDWWLSNSSSAAAKAADPSGAADNANCGCGSTAGIHGTLAQWKTAIPAAKMYAGGFSLGSGVKNDGVIGSISYDGVSYVPTNEAKPTATTPGQGGTTTPSPTATTTATPTKPVKDVTGTVKAKTPNILRLKLNFVSDATPTGSTEGKALKYKVKVDGVLASKVTQGAAEKDVFARVFPRNSGIHKVQVYKNGALVSTYKVRTS
jgi:hypothetical protein